MIADLGLSKILTEKNTICGTICYAAPEIIKKNKAYDHKIDMWSCGVVLYTMLSGIMPFSKNYTEKLGGMNIKKQIVSAKIDFSHRGFANVESFTIKKIDY